MKGEGRVLAASVLGKVAGTGGKTKFFWAAISHISVGDEGKSSRVWSCSLAVCIVEHSAFLVLLPRTKRLASFALRGRK